jgi:hypothetical protein
VIKRLERLKNTVNKYMADIQPDRLDLSVRTEVCRKSTTKCTAESEQHFFIPNHVKTSLRNSVAQKGLNALAILSMYEKHIINILGFIQKVNDKCVS